MCVCVCDHVCVHIVYILTMKYINFKAYVQYSLVSSHEVMGYLLRVPLDNLDSLDTQEQAQLVRTLFDTLNKAVAQRDKYAQRLDACLQEKASRSQ